MSYLVSNLTSSVIDINGVSWAVAQTREISELSEEIIAAKDDGFLSIENLSPEVPSGSGNAVAGFWSAAGTLSQAVASQFIAATVTTASESSYSFEPSASAFSLLGGAAYAATAVDPLPLVKTGTNWGRVTVPAIDAGDNVINVILGLINDNENIESAFSKLNNIGITPGDGSYEAFGLLAWNGASFNLQLGYVNDGVASNTGTITTVNPGQELYFGIDWATGTLYYQIDEGAPTSFGITLTTGFEQLDWNAITGMVFTAQTVAFLAGSVNFDLSDTTGSHLPFQVGQQASYPESPQNKVYEISGGGTVDGIELFIGDYVVFDSDGLSFTRLNDEPYVVVDKTDYVIFAPTVQPTGNLYNTWLAAYNAVKASAYKKRIIIIDDGNGVTITNSVGITPTSFWQMEGIVVEGVNINRGLQAAVTFAENCVFNLDPAATVAGNSAIGEFKKLAITCNSGSIANFTKTAVVGLGNWVFEDCNVSVATTALAPAFLCNITNSDMVLTFRGACNLVQFANATLFAVNNADLIVQVYGALNTSFFSKSTAITGSGNIFFDLYLNADIDLYYDNDWSLFTGFSGTIQVRSQLSVKSLVIDNQTDYAYPAIKHAAGQLGAPEVISNTLAINPNFTKDYQVTAAAAITFNADALGAQIGAELRFFITTAAAVSFAAGTAAVNTRAAGLNSAGQYAVVHAKRMSANTWLLWGDLVA